MTRVDADDEKDATFSLDGNHRYTLRRTWDETKGTVLFVMLNPSTADEHTLDPTCTRCRVYAEEWGYGELLVGNIFSYRATDPDDLKEARRPNGTLNDVYLRQMAQDAHLIVCAWGVEGDHRGRGREVAELLDAEGHTLHHLGLTQDGHPRHPLYLPGGRKPETFDPESIDG